MHGTTRCTFVTVAVALALIFGSITSLWAAGAAASGPLSDDTFSHQTLAVDDGWAAFSGGTTGGTAAPPDRVYNVTNRAQLVAALAGGDAPRIVIVQGTIAGNVDDTNAPLSCDAYTANGYTRDTYLAAYAPAVWGRERRPSGLQEDARVVSQRAQAARVKIAVPANTTIIGVGRGAQLRGVNLILDGANNVIIRNLNFENPTDCFPQWDPTDGADGNWNAQYDSISLLGATHVWVDHCAFRDGDRPDRDLPTYFGRLYQVHDGALDITNGSDLVTASWNRFTDHDKTMLIGSTDNPRLDAGKLRVTLHHNHFAGVGQRAPRVRYGQVHVYNNLYDVFYEAQTGGYTYSWGVGVESRLFGQENAFRTGPGVLPEYIVRVFNGTALHDEGTRVNGTLVDVRSAYNAANGANLSGDVGWTPTLHGAIDPAATVPELVAGGAGPLRVTLS